MSPMTISNNWTQPPTKQHIPVTKMSLLYDPQNVFLKSYLLVLNTLLCHVLLEPYIATSVTRNRNVGIL